MGVGPSSRKSLVLTPNLDQADDVSACRDSLMMDETMANAPPSPDWPSMEERQEYLEEINAEMSIYLSILYFMAEIFRGDQDWAEELSEFLWLRELCVCVCLD